MRTSTAHIVAAALALAMLTPAIARAARTNATWIGASSGTDIWDSDANWSSDATPNDGNTTPNNPNQTFGEYAHIGDATGDRTIVTPSATTSFLVLLGWAQTSNAVNTIKLGGDLNQIRFEAASGWSNTTGSAANLVLDLNGHTYYRNYHVPPAGVAYTVKTSAPGGVFRRPAMYAGSLDTVIDAGVTVEIYRLSSHMNQIWHPDTTLHVISNNDTANVYYMPLTGIGNLIIGRTTNTGPARMTGFVSTATVIIHEDVTINTYAGAVGGDASDLEFLSSAVPLNFYVGGNFIDYASDNSSYEGAPTASGKRRTIIFNGGDASPNTVNIGRSGLLNDFQVGVDNVDFGNVVLAHDLTTTGWLSVRDGSTLDVADWVVGSGNFTAAAGSTLKFTEAVDQGRIDVTGTVTVAGTLTADLSGLTAHSHLVLIDNDDSDAISGSFANAPQDTVLTSPVGPYRVQYDWNGNDLALAACIPCADAIDSVTEDFCAAFTAAPATSVEEFVDAATELIDAIFAATVPCSGTEAACRAEILAALGL